MRFWRLVLALGLGALTACSDPSSRPSDSPTVEAQRSGGISAPATPSPPPEGLGGGETRTPTALLSTVAASGEAEAEAVPVPRTATPTPGLASTAEPPVRSTLALKPPGSKVRPATTPTQLAALVQQAEASEMAADYRKLGEKALSLHLYPWAVTAFRKEAAIYRAKGLPQAALAQEARAREYDTRLTMYLSTRSPKPVRKLERLEPPAGCYVGAFIDRDDSLSQFMEASQTHGDVDEFNALMKKPHASFFMYRSYGQPFPSAWARYLKERDAIVHIAWEPKSLDQVKDDLYLREFVDDLVALDHPVMLRFASEMNGEWTPYHGDPEAYKKAFRLVHQATRRAPKVAMMWCPNTIPRQGLEAYYPGDRWVDWVGVNFYSVPFLDNDRSRPGERIHPADQLQAVYDLYSARKPIAIGEWAASRESKARPGPMTEFARTKISQLYSTLPTRFPRVKMVNWYDSNNLVQASPGRQLNNFQVTTPADLRDHYARAVASSHYLGAGQSSAKLAFQPLNQRSGEITSESWFRIALQTYEPRPKVYFEVNGARVLATADALDWRLGPQHWVKGKNLVRVSVYDRQDRFVTQAEAVLKL